MILAAGEASAAVRDALPDFAAVLNADRDHARTLVEICDPSVNEWLGDPDLRAFGLIGPDGERAQVLGVEIGVIGDRLDVTVVIDPVPGTVGGWLELDLMRYIGAVSLRAGQVLVHI